jgi:hypothetical protein
VGRPRALVQDALLESNDPRTSRTSSTTTGSAPQRVRAPEPQSTSSTSTTRSGPFFIRVGKQAISWGESDTIAILDVSNPFDLTLGAPGFFQDVEEARIPLWTIRSTYKLIDTWGPALERLQRRLLRAGPDRHDGADEPDHGRREPVQPRPGGPAAQRARAGRAGRRDIHTVLVDRLPDQTWGNSRWGARLTGVLLRDYTVQGWFFRTFNQQPVPMLTNASAFGLLSKGQGTFVDDRGRKCDPATGGRLVHEAGARRHAARPPARVGDRPVVDVVQPAGERASSSGRSSTSSTSSRSSPTRT